MDALRPPLRILVVEDSEDDANINVRMLERAGFRVHFMRVEEPAHLREALAAGRWDAILADYHMPAFTGLDALQIVRDAGLDLPFILVSGALGEEGAVAVLTAGASDYVMKGQLARLPKVLARELEKAAARRAEREAQRRLQLVIDNVPAMIAYVDADYRLAYANHRYRMFYAGGDVPVEGRTLAEVLTPEAWRTAEPDVTRALSGEAINQRGARRLHDGSLRHVAVSLVPDRDDAGVVRGMYVLALDVTAQQEAEDALRESEAGLRRLNRVYAVLSGINAALVRIRDRQELFDEACRIAIEAGGFRFAWICGVDAAQARLVPLAQAGQGGDLLSRIKERLSLRDDAPHGHGLAARAARENRAIFVNDIAESAVRDKDVHLGQGLRSFAVLPIAVGGRTLAVLGLHSQEPHFFDDEEQRLLLELAGDIAFALEHMEKEERVRFLAYYDQLTGLANRDLLLERLAQQLAVASRDQHKAALMILNIDRFKAINDAEGRQAGDAILRQVAERLVRAAGDPGNVARIGGDQFAVLLPRVRRLESLQRRLEENSRAFDAMPYKVGASELRVSTRAGVALFPDDGADAEALFRNAEAAVKAADSTDRYLFYTAKMTARVGERLQLENKMRLALEHGEFVLHYQPKISLETLRLTGAEVLIRWESPEGGLVPPMDFVPLLEETGLIAEVGLWALRQAVADHTAWRKRGLVTPRVAVNVSAVQLRRSDFVSILKGMLAEAGGDPGIDLEITETLVMSDLEENIAKLRAIRDLGVDIVVDDFGTGYSSLAYLARLPAAAVKIDRSFVHDMTREADAMTLVSTIVSLGHSLRLKVIAEGVETQAQADYLRVMRCDEVQGFFFGRPAPAAEFEKLLKFPA
ncbi:MAG: EAL domain-containing protein [Clostridia bacterium]